jgi:UDP-glucuronate 4-epimerase
MDFIKAIESETGKKAQIELMPMQQGDVKKTWADVELLEKDISYKPLKDIKYGINKFIDWYRNFYHEDGQ